MNKIYIALCFLLLSFSASAQHLSQYNTGTLYDSFENPSQRSFIPDSSRQYAFNFFIPNFDANAYITGNIQPSLKNRLFGTSYGSKYLQIGQHKNNHINANVNAYAIMLKAFTSLNGDVEMGFSYQVRAESRGLFSDETLALFDSPQRFDRANTYQNIFNNNFLMQNYNQIGFSYRERINKQFAFGFKVSALLGIKYSQFDINKSSISFDTVNNTAALALRGKYYSSYIPGRPSAHDYLPTFRSPGASISFGTSYTTEDKITIQANIKDLGFIHWSSRSLVSNFDAVDTLKSRGPGFVNFPEDTIYDRTIDILRSGNSQPKSFTTKTNARAELSATKTFWIDPDDNFKYSPTLIGSKEIWFTGFTAALVNHVQYHNYTGTITASYDDTKLFNIGAQFMYKTPNFEFFAGSDRLVNTGRLAFAATGSQTQMDHLGTYSGMDLFLGFSMKFGAVIEHPMNASYIPMGEKGFFGRLWGRIFKTDK
jgi:hypothetical protein